MMRSPIIFVSVLLLTTGVAQAQHAGSFTGRRGNTTTWNTNVSNGVATGSITGPKGYTTSGSVSEHYVGHGAYGVTGTVIGPRGGTYTRSGTVYPQ